MSIWLIRTVLPDIDGVAADEVVNDMVFSTEATAAAVSSLVADFWNLPVAAGSSVSSFIGASRSRVPLVPHIDAYDITGHLDGSPHGSPVNLLPMDLVAAGTAGQLPQQVAITLALHAAFGSVLEHGPTEARPSDEGAIDEGAPATHPAVTRPKSTLRGRIYIGPVTGQAIGNDGLLAAGFLQTLSQAATRLREADNGWSVWSRSTAAVHPIVGGWIDRNPTVVRRRRPKTTVTVAWPNLL